jgi:hypothetical protein
MANRAVSRRNASHVGAFSFAGVLILYWVTGARGLVWTDPSKLTLYALGVLGAVALWRGHREPRGSTVWAWSLGGLSLLLVYAPFRLHLMLVFLLVGLVLALPVRLPARGRLGHVVFQSLLCLAVAAVLTVAGRQNLGVRVLPDRNNAFYFLCPFKGASVATQAAAKAAPTPAQSGLRSAVLRWERAVDPGTRAYLADFGACVPAGAPAVVLADFNPGAVLRLAQVVRGWRPELDIRPVAVTPHGPATVGDRWPS